MVNQGTREEQSSNRPFHLRKLAKSGSSRYISVGTILPKDWEAVKVYVEDLTAEGCLLKIIPIR